MRATPSSRADALLAIAACVGLAVLNWHVLVMDIEVSPLTAGADLGQAQVSAPPEISTDADAASPSIFPQTVARPLFRSSRRPADAAKIGKAPVAAAELPAKLPEDIQLVGVIKEGENPGRALIRSNGAPTGEWIDVGHMLEGWRLARVERGSIVLEAGKQSERLSLFPAGRD